MNSIIDAHIDYAYHWNRYTGRHDKPATAMDHKLRAEDRVFKFKSKYSAWSTDQKIIHLNQQLP